MEIGIHLWMRLALLLLQVKGMSSDINYENRETIVIATKLVPPWVQFKDKNSHKILLSNDEYYEGFFVDVCREICMMIGVDFVLNPHTDDLTKSFIEKRDVQMAGPALIDSRDFLRVDFTASFLSSRLNVVSLVEQNSINSRIFLPFDPLAWLTVVIGLLMLSTLFIIGRTKTQRRKKKDEHSAKYDLWLKTSHTMSSASIIISIVILSTIYIVTFGLEPITRKEPSDFTDHPELHCNSSFTHSIKNCIEELKSGKINTIAIYQHDIDTLNTCDMQSISDLQTTLDFSFILTKDSSMTEVVSMSILKLSEVGRIDELYRKWFHGAVCPPRGAGEVRVGVACVCGALCVGVIGSMPLLVVVVGYSLGKWSS
ncbi:hypothetical protein CAPTEDRAFT_207281 [Capitella teleta]|uniref:Solute-binding protein family 3/N-terminal domain-containing protein n=1 Tax=Capitella teleta TaxID=283909 RepID=R7UN57_CAPTE|nr:hypothetical protein CAPTEDRAFT_207281 [Capitella teleta]|eukprot:ELU07969.1 hypothetical protein CAPTEDRAFT_207281 [Capitella teleta]